MGYFFVFYAGMALVVGVACKNRTETGAVLKTAPGITEGDNWQCDGKVLLGNTSNVKDLIFVPPELRDNATEPFYYAKFIGPKFDLYFLSGPDMEGQAPLGARLTQIVYKREDGSTEHLLHQNKDGAGNIAIKRTQKGREGNFLSFGGIEPAYPNQEHGEVSGLKWNYVIDCNGSQPAFIATSRPGRSPAAYDLPQVTGTIEVRTSIDETNESIIQTVKTVDIDQENRSMYWGNIMVPAGTESSPDNIELLFPISVENIFIHSSNDGSYNSGSIPENYNNPVYKNQFLEDLGRIRQLASYELARFPNKESGKFIGYFHRSKISGYKYYNHSRGHGLDISSPQGFYPKVFCGPNLTASHSHSGQAFCEMWYSPNAETFWHDPREVGNLNHELNIKPFRNI